MSWSGFVTQSLSMERQLQLVTGRDLNFARWLPPVTDPPNLAQLAGAQSGPVVAVMTGGPDWRVRYKGLDRVALISRYLRKPVRVCGTWESTVVGMYEMSVDFIGASPPAEALDGALCLLHPARRDSFPLVIIEAMLAGVPPVVSGAGNEWLVSAVEPRLVVTHWSEALACIDWLRSMPAEQYLELGGRLRAQAGIYSDYTATPQAIDGVRGLLSRVVSADRRSAEEACL